MSTRKGLQKLKVHSKPKIVQRTRIPTASAFDARHEEINESTPLLDFTDLTTQVNPSVGRQNSLSHNNMHPHSSISLQEMVDNDLHRASSLPAHMFDQKHARRRSSLTRSMSIYDLTEDSQALSFYLVHFIITFMVLLIISLWVSYHDIMSLLFGTEELECGFTLDCVITLMCVIEFVSTVITSPDRNFCHSKVHVFDFCCIILSLFSIGLSVVHVQTVLPGIDDLIDIAEKGSRLLRLPFFLMLLRELFHEIQESHEDQHHGHNSHHSHKEEHHHSLNIF